MALLFTIAAQAQEQGVGADPVPLNPGEEPVAHGEIVAVTEGHDAGFPPMNPEFYPSQILWLAITFGILYFLMQRIVLPRVAGVLENRHDRIALDLEAAERMRTDADEAQAAYEQELTEARERARAIANDARDEARAEADRERARIEAQQDEKLDAAERHIGEVKLAAMGEIDTVARELAGTIMREVAHLEASDEDIARAVEQARR